MEPEYDDPDAMVSSPSAMSPNELPMQGPDDEPSTITIVPPWVSYKKHLTQRYHPAFQLQPCQPLAYCPIEVGMD